MTTSIIISSIAILLSGISAVFLTLAWLEQREANRHLTPCRAYWGTHGCKKTRGHRGPHRCDRGCRKPPEDETLFGEDVTR